MTISHCGLLFLGYPVLVSTASSEMITLCSYITSCL